MYLLIATVSGLVGLPEVSVRATMNSFHAEMNVKISAVTMPGAASGSVIRGRAPIRPPVDHGRLLQLDGDRGEEGVEYPHGEGEVEAGVDHD